MPTTSPVSRSRFLRGSDPWSARTASWAPSSWRTFHPCRGQSPQIEVVFDIDANGILNVSAEELSTKRKNQITITNDKGRLSKADIEKMVQDAEKFAADDERMRETMESKAYLENYCFSLKDTMNSEDVMQRVSESDRQQVTTLASDALTWLDDNQQATKDDYDSKIKELEGVCFPILKQYHADRHMAEAQKTTDINMDGSAPVPEPEPVPMESEMPGTGGMDVD
eukprot:NODE_1808_length_1062_cov_95.917078_g1475_i0.p1 GENE.NODE_1808_length_1062_cov_95.917078_g1475_i0~~NODE_1808_length_1062_cov_95.917078_g1475_i0.p1  ORF type:complete len:225 (-),score=59.84 NODE_1808_length_1062_cov_95.917078_g1475_i0:278-952(-)